MMTIKAKPVTRGIAEGEAIVSHMPISFTGGMDPNTGVIREPGHDLEGQSVAGKILVFPMGKGSTTGSWQFYAAFKYPLIVMKLNKPLSFLLYSRFCLLI